MNQISKQHQDLLSHIKKEKERIHTYYNEDIPFLYHSNHEIHEPFLGIPKEQEERLYQIITYKATIICQKLPYYFAFMEFFSLPFFLIPKNYKIFCTDVVIQDPKVDSFASYLKNRHAVILPWPRLQSFKKDLETVRKPYRLEKGFLEKKETAYLRWRAKNKNTKSTV